MQIIDVDLDSRLPRGKALHEVAHVAQADGVDGRQLHLARHLGVRGADDRLQLLILLEQGFRPLVVRLAQCGELQGARGPIYELHVHAPFELRHNLADRRLCDIVCLGSLGETSVTRDVTKDLQRPKLHAGMISS